MLMDVISASGISLEESFVKTFIGQAQKSIEEQQALQFNDVISHSRENYHLVSVQINFLSFSDGGCGESERSDQTQRKLETYYILAIFVSNFPCEGEICSIP
jgi:hypothetical protein